ncbi:MAG: creatininase family protein [Ectothiorhodospiraceae bacterium]|nr:creatininase family protein [Ectothiorhodospiraceae bacterium]
MIEIEWHNLKAYELRERAAQDAILIVPCGSTEQHGPHLPVQVDALLATEVSKRAARLVAEEAPVVVAPTVWCGLAEHHMALGGTITLDHATYHALLRCVCRSAVRHGFRRILLMNGHGGNINALNVIAGELSVELGAPIATGTYWTITGIAKAFREILEKQENVRHAGEAETSMLLALRPDLVDQEAMRTVEADQVALVGPTGIYRYRSFADITPAGVIGVPSAASAKKGERLLEAAGRELARAILSGGVWG